MFRQPVIVAPSAGETCAGGDSALAAAESTRVEPRAKAKVAMLLRMVCLSSWRFSDYTPRRTKCGRDGSPTPDPASANPCPGVALTAAGTGHLSSPAERE